MIVCIGFILAGLLIAKSYSAWRDAPIATTISTHPISELDFPTVTVCPPKGSHTALYYDLMKAHNNSLSEEDRNSLKHTIFKSITEPSHQKYIRDMIAATNLENLEQVYEGFQSAPKVFLESGFEIEVFMWKNADSIHTSWYGEKNHHGYYDDDQQQHVIFQLPYSMGSRLGDGLLVIHLEVDTRIEKGWLEEVKYKDRLGYQYFDHLKTWDEAEAYCQGKGGHLASILSAQAKREADNLVSDTYWVGGRKQNSGVWTWVDGSPWGYGNWDYGYGTRGGDNNCVQKSYQGWLDVSCTEKSHFMCEASPKLVTGRKNVTLKYTRGQLDFATFQVWYSYKKANKEVLNSWEDKNVTGFRLSWFIEDSNGSRLSERMPDPGQEPVDPIEPFLRNMIQLASRARVENITESDIIQRAIKEKARLLENESFEFAKNCSMSQVKPYIQGFYGFSAKSLGLEPSTVKATAITITREDIKIGFSIFAVFVHCSESIPLSNFLHRLVSSQSPRTIIQATVNTVKTGDLKDSVDKRGMSQFYEALDQIFNLQLGKILLAVSSPEEIKTMMDRDMPYFTKYKKEIEPCINGTNFQDIGDLINSLGNIVFILFIIFSYVLPLFRIQGQYD